MPEPPLLMTVRQGAGPIRDGSVWRCTVELGDELVEALVKPVPAYQVVREVLCAMIAEEAGLPVLRPGVVPLDRSPLRTPERFAFGTLALDARPLPRMRDDNVLRRHLAQWPHLALAIAFDEWIGNSDRTVGNLLFRGAGDFVLIDHGEAIPADMSPQRASTANLLALLAFADVRRDEERAALQRVRSAAARLHEVDMASVMEASRAELWSPPDMLRECCRWLTDRLPHLDDLIAGRFGSGQRSLSMQPSKESTRDQQRLP